MRQARWFALILATCSAMSLLSARSPSSQPAPTYAGSDACKTCHEGQWQAFQTNAHHRAETDAAVVADHVGCEGCHGPGSLHVGASGDKSDPGFATIRNFKNLKAEEVSATCTGCHKNGDQFYWQHSEHNKRGVSCINCHSIHHEKNVGPGPLLKAKDVTQLCTGCHKDKRASIARSAHMPLAEGGMTCASCHNPHGTATDKMLKATTPNELCLTCHTDKRGPFLWEHAPVRENCMNCHQPHGSNNDKVLASKRPYLCQRCHVATRHPSTLYDANDLTSNRLLNRACNNCHTQIHGSNHPSGEFFTR